MTVKNGLERRVAIFVISGTDKTFVYKDWRTCDKSQTIVIVPHDIRSGDFPNTRCCFTNLVLSIHCHSYYYRHHKNLSHHISVSWINKRSVPKHQFSWHDAAFNTHFYKQLYFVTTSPTHQRYLEHWNIAPSLLIQITWCGYKVTRLMFKHFLFKKLHNRNVVTLNVLPSPIPTPLHANLPLLEAMLQVVFW